MSDFESKDDEILYWKKRSLDLENQLCIITSAPLVVELDIPEQFAKKDFVEFTNKGIAIFLLLVKKLNFIFLN